MVLDIVDLAWIAMKELLFLREIYAPKYRIDLLYGCKATLFC